MVTSYPSKTATHESVIPPSIAGDDRLKALIAEAVKPGAGVVHACGVWGSAGPMAIGEVAKARAGVILYVTAHVDHADAVRDDMELFRRRACELFPAWETLPGEGAGSREIEAERLRICSRLHRLGSTGEVVDALVVVAPIQALMQPVPVPQVIQDNTLVIDVGPHPHHPHLSRPDAILDWALDRGFQRLELVESPGDVARRGDIVDVFALGETDPFRIQFFDNEVESIRRFDTTSQRSIEPLDSVSVAALRKGDVLGDAVANLSLYLPSDALIVLDGPAELQALGETILRRLGDSPGLFPVEDVLADCVRFRQIHLSRFPSAAIADEPRLDLAVGSVARFDGIAGEAVAELVRVAGENDVYVFCDNEGERQRLQEMLAEQPDPASPSIHLHLGALHRGFAWTRTSTVVLSHHEIFHRERHRRRIRRVHAGKPLESWTDLKPGEYVVHVVHGIAVYRGLAPLKKGTSNQQEEFLSLEFADKAVIHVPCSQIDLVQKYIGAGGARPRLSKIGGKRWSRTKEQVTDAVSELAETLLRVQARRENTQGTAYPADTEWQREFEAAFPYEETEDQLVVAEDIKHDLARARPMDRLICGDVGYGKTELAMRAAFKVVEYGRQVAVLVPTTVLAEQHDATFRDRMSEYPFTIGCLSRFRRSAEQKKILQRIKKGQLDIVVGTHRLLSSDVSFANLGLVIVDEEQRFGVEHKERLKAMRETVDVMTLTATPIPRTLHISMIGLRDISSLQTPPVDRRAIATTVRPFDRGLIREGILRELNRGGQVYFVHNFVQSIAAMATTIQEIVPEARVVYGHGQMKDDELEAVMHRFVRREADVLLSTTIIESGIDIPSANTVFINRADRFGLADLHQLRGRVGRSDHRAYCYLLLPPDRPPNRKAGQRLKTIEEFSELGAGFRIAMRDLEIRGAGNLLGKEQSGHIGAVGYEMYCRLLEQTVRRLRNEPDPTPPPVHLDLEVVAHIPKSYIRSERSRIEIYRRIVACRAAADLDQLQRDLADAFGAYPPQVSTLLELAEIRVHARRFGIRSISLLRPDVVFGVDSLPRAEPVFVDAAGTVRMPDPKTVHLRLPPRYLDPGTLLPVLRKMLNP